LSLPLPITYQLIIINEEKDEAEPLQIRSPFRGRCEMLVAKKSLTNGAKQTISRMPFYGGCRTDPAMKKHNNEDHVYSP
jgi:hypothetical protein